MYTETGSAAYQRTLRARRLAAGRCPRCGGERDGSGRLLCERCRAYGQTWDARRLERRRLNPRLCYFCKVRPAVGHYKSCAECRAGLIAKHAPKVRAYQQRLRMAALARYGRVCQCCGESQPAFLAIDHINNDGAAHRRAIGRRSVYKWLLDHGYPDGFQVLCHNCNMAKQFYGTCPHQEGDDYYHVH